MDVMEFELPLHWVRKYKGKVSKQALSFNLVTAKGFLWYNARKKFFSKELKKQLIGNEPKGVGQIKKLTYTICCHSRQDLMNIGSVLDKFFQDFLVLEGIITSDNIDVVTNVQFLGIKVPPEETFAKVRVEL